MINELKENEIFVFGSNLNGNHYGGAAKQAHEQFGAEWGVGEGMCGEKCYAFPTLNEKMEKRTDEELKESVDKLWICCMANPKLKFILTKVGCGIAGYDEEYIKSLFREVPKNLIKPLEWQKQKITF